MPTITNTLQKFQESIAALRARLGNQLPTQTWRDIEREAHDRAFVVAGAAKAELLADLAKAVEDSINKGLGLDYFRKQFDKIVERYGWPYKGERKWRTRVIYGTNLRVSYAAGRLRQLRSPALQKLKPYWKYVHSDNVLNPRPLHVSWNGLILPADHPWFQTHYPPNGWGCNCRIVAVTKAEYERSDKRGAPDDGSRAINGRDVPNGIDEGWDYMPGNDGDAERIAAQAAAKLPEPLADAYKNAMARKVMQPAQTSGDSSLDAIYDYGMRQIVSVHRMPDMQPIRLAVNANPDRRGEYDYQTRELKIDSKTDRIDPEFVVVHEVGHILDEELFGIRRRSLGSKLSPQARKVISAIKRSKLFRQLRKSNFELRNYLMLDNELFARAYTQFIATRSGNPILMQNLNYHRNHRKPFFAFQQWPDDDFAEIDASISALLKSEGLL